MYYLFFHTIIIVLHYFKVATGYLQLDNFIFWHTVAGLYTTSAAGIIAP